MDSRPVIVIIIENKLAHLLQPTTIFGLKKINTGEKVNEKLTIPRTNGSYMFSFCFNGQKGITTEGAVNCNLIEKWPKNVVGSIFFLVDNLFWGLGKWELFKYDEVFKNS